MTGVAILPGGARVAIAGQTVSELERRADSLGARSYRYDVDGGVVRMIRIGGEWVAL